ncbi:hypothetical protein D3C76_1557440 [compost metagenome]
MYSQPSVDTMIPPRLGPAMLPSDTKVPIRPSALPRSLAGKISVTIPWLFAIVIDAPIAWMTRETMRNGRLVLRPQSRDPIMNTIVPILKILILPTISPSLPKNRIMEQMAIK